MTNTSINAQAGTKSQNLETVESGNNTKAGVSSKKNQSNKRTYNKQPVFMVLRSARTQYKYQLDKGSETKKRCISVALAASPDLYSDQRHFELDFYVERERLLDSKRFCKSCKDLNLNPIHVADNIVFEGKAVLDKVLKEGLQYIGEDVQNYNSPLWNNTEGLYKEEVVNE